MKVGFWTETDGSPSFRRLGATFFALCFPILSVLAFKYIDNGWIVFIPAALALLGVLLLMFFTTWEAIKGLISAAKGKD